MACTLLLLIFYFFSTANSQQSQIKYITNDAGWPICAYPAPSSVPGQFKINDIIRNCSSRIPGSTLPPSYFKAANTSSTGDEILDFPPTTISVQMVLNNFLSVDDLTSEIKMDFILRLYWTDPRWYLPYLFVPQKNLNPNVIIDGFDITGLVDDEGEPLLVYKPDIFFLQAIQIEIVSESIKFDGESKFSWERHMVAKFAESQMSFKSYPLDKQNFSMVIQSYSHTLEFVELDPLEPEPIQFLYDSQSNKDYFDENQLWEYNSYTIYRDDQIVPTKRNRAATYGTLFINFEFERQSLGVIYRLAFPVGSLLLVVGFSFWGSREDRIHIALNLLLVVAAMYIVIGQVIPLVGYLTTIDVFITVVFSLLTFVVLLHLIVIILDKKSLKYPFNIFRRDVCEFIFRCLWIPMSILIFSSLFDLPTFALNFTLRFFAGLYMLASLGQIPYLMLSFKASIVRLRLKEKRVLAAKELANKATHEIDSDDEEEPAQSDNSPQVDTEELCGEDEQREKAHIYKLTWFEKFLLRRTRHMYNDSKSNMEVFGATAVKEDITLQQKNAPQRGIRHVNSVNTENLVAKPVAVGGDMVISIGGKGN